jgi:hypothetical protein
MTLPSSMGQELCSIQIPPIVTCFPLIHISTARKCIASLYISFQLEYPTEIRIVIHIRQQTREGNYPFPDMHGHVPIGTGRKHMGVSPVVL